MKEVVNMLGIICGLESEMKLVRGLENSLASCAAARPELALQKARELVGQGATRLLSFGLAGGLKQGLPAGAVVIATSVQTLSENWECDAEWVATLQRLLPEAHSGKTFGSDVILSDSAQKIDISRRFDCLFVDMESQCVAQVAMEAKIPFAVLRVVTDTCNMNFPPVALMPMREDGRINLRNILSSILQKPQQIPALIRLGINTGRAVQKLKKIVVVCAEIDSV